MINSMMGDTLKWKLKAEEYIRQSSLPSYTIIRPGRLPKDGKVIKDGNFTPANESYRL